MFDPQYWQCPTKPPRYMPSGHWSLLRQEGSTGPMATASAVATSIVLLQGSEVLSIYDKRHPVPVMETGIMAGLQPPKAVDVVMPGDSTIKIATAICLIMACLVLWIRMAEPWR